MWALLSLIWLSTAVHAGNNIDSQDRAIIEEWLYSVDEKTPHGRLQVAIQAFESEPSREIVLAFGSTHPHIAFMLTDPISRMALIYSVLLRCETLLS